MSVQAVADPFRPQPAAGLRAGGLMSALVHLGLVAVFAALVWRSAPPRTVTAELWTAVPQQAAPPALIEEAVPLKPEPAPTPPPPPPKAAAPTPAPREADIALRKAQEQQQRDKLEDERKRERLEREKAEKAKAEREKAERQKLERERAEKEKTERLKAEQDKEKARREKAERERRELAERQRAEKAAEQRAEKLRQENLARLQGLAGATGAPDAAGSAQHSSGPSAGYAGRIRARIKPLIVYPDAGAGNPVAEVEVRLSPTGVIIGSRLVRRSGTPEWDNAVLRAVEKAEVLPRDVDGRVPSVMVLVFSPRE